MTLMRFPEGNSRQVIALASGDFTGHDLPCRERLLLATGDIDDAIHFGCIGPRTADPDISLACDWLIENHVGLPADLGLSALECDRLLCGHEPFTPLILHFFGDMLRQTRR